MHAGHSPGPKAVIRIENIAKRYARAEALKGVSLDVAQGEIFAYLGPNGAGKTTTIRILTGLTRLSGGTAVLGGHDIQAEPLQAKRQCGLVPQAVNLDNELSVRENLDIHGRLFGLPGRARRERMAALLDYVGLGGKERTQVKKLSGGLKRRAMIARALMHEPRILFLDEPSVGLDPAIRRKIWGLIRQIQADGTTIFLTTHYIEEAEFLADRVAFLDEGRIVALDQPARLMDSLGQWSVDLLQNHHMETRHFQTREEAQAYAAARECSFTVRRVNLEDAFLAQTGKKIL